MPAQAGSQATGANPRYRFRAHRGGISGRPNVNEFQIRPANCPRSRGQASRYSSCRL